MIDWLCCQLLWPLSELQQGGLLNAGQVPDRLLLGGHFTLQATDPSEVEPHWALIRG